MKQEKIDRINELAHKAKAEGLTEEEIAERDALRQEYIQSVVGNLRDELEHTYVVDKKGLKHKLKPKNDIKS